ncbi:MAG: hypothetical protein ACE5G5_02850 [Candidatus Methylomirabilales bacterium]
MKREDFLKAFAEMSPEDQEAVRAGLIGKGSSQETADPMAMCQRIMEKIMASGDPMAMCREMMGKMEAGGDPMAMVKEMTEKMKAGGNPMAICEKMMQTMKGKCC